MNALLAIRNRATDRLALLVIAHVPVIALLAVLLNKSWIGPTIGAAAIALVIAGMTWRMKTDLATRFAIGAGLMAMISIVLFTMSGHPWQIDVHMYYFAALAMLAAMCCWRTLVVAAGVVAVHHLALNFLLPAAVFPDDTDLSRVVLHAVIVVMETGVLLWLTRTVETSLVSAETTMSDLQATEAERQRLAKEQQRSEEEARLARQAVLSDLAQSLEQSVGSIANTVSGAAEELDTTARGLADSTVRVGQLTDRVAGDAAASTEQALQAEASVTEMTDAIREIADHVDRAGRITRNAVDHVQRTDGTVNGLAEAAQRIGQVLTLIQDIAEQTNLLALNATIEAA